MNKRIKAYIAFFVLSLYLIQIIIPMNASAGENNELMYPIQEMSKLECRFQDFSSLSDGCKMILPILNTKDYKKYATKNGGYNDFTRIYTVLWGSSYKYGWDVGSGGHQGVDIASARGTPVYSIADGVVIRVGNDAGWGKYVSIEHVIKGKRIVSNYAHLAKYQVNKGDEVYVGDKIGEVGSTGNSTGNHLHFQIDLPYKFHPYYYDWNTCPYGYLQITETGVCFDQLAEHTIDPLKFLESNGAVLDEIKVRKATTSSSSSSSSSTTNSTKSIFDTTVYYGYGTSDDVKEIQRIYNKLGYYDGRISGDFEDIEKSLIEYQIATGVIADANSDGAGWFGPMTRTQTKADYDSYVASGGQSVLAGQVSTTVKSEEETVVSAAAKVENIEVISRESLMTREEREAQEMAEFLSVYSIGFENTVSQISTNTTDTSIIKIQNKRGKPFRGNTPGKITFKYDKDVISLFPEGFYNFTDGTREIKITGKQAGNTELTIKIGEVEVKTMSISVGEQGENPKVSSAKIYTKDTITQGNIHTGIVLLKDQYDNKLVGAEYDDTFTIANNSNTRYCIKKGAVSEVKSIYARKCLDEEFQDTLTYSYNDTIEGVLIFDYKVLEKKDSTLSLKKSGANFSTHTVVVNSPKGLSTTHEYYEQINDSIESGIASTNGEYFLEDREITVYDAKKWIHNAFPESQEILSVSSKDKVENMTRKDFLDLVSQGVGVEGSSASQIAYRDIDKNETTLVATLLGSEYQWKDSFGENYFQPEKELTRAEAAYMLQTAMKNRGRFVALR